jgi:hypothetical protein
LEYGVNYIHQYDNYNDSYNGLGALYYQKTWLWSSNYYFAYRLIYKNKHILKLSNTYFEIRTTNVPFTAEKYKLGANSDIYSLGYGYKLPIEKVSISFFGVLNYRYKGGEAAISNLFQNAYWSEASYAFLYYNSPWGFGTGVELEYFFTKHIGLGINTYFHAFPWESAQFESNNVGELFPEFLEKYQTNKFFVNSTIKLAYKFALPKFAKKSTSN